MNFDSHVRHVLLLDSNGKPSVFIGRPGKTPLEIGETQKMFFTRAHILLKTADADDKFLGKTRTLIAEREKVTLVWFAFEKNFTVLVTAEPGFSVTRVDDLRRIVDDEYKELLTLRQVSA
jgi:hypothetical protein